ncbi:chorismate dehydratase [Planctomycetales bacterium]|nr:chorismate dehydratase [Planctomycetales bacterium]
MKKELVSHNLDLVLMPVAELLTLPEGIVTGDCCIASNGNVRSVCLFSKKPLEKIETLALDTASRSSITLGQLVFRYFYNRSPALEKLPQDKPLNECPADGFIVIGDRCLSFSPSEKWEYRYDLGSVWKEKTGLPFVFAAWITCGKSTAADEQLINALSQSRDFGLQKIIDSLDNKSGNKLPLVLPLPDNEMKSYFTDNIVYKLGNEERKGLAAFLKLAADNGIVPQYAE